MLLRLQSAISLLTCGCLVSLAASPASIGFVVTNGQIKVDGSAVQGNATLFSGSLVQAGIGTSDVVFPGGSNLLMQPGSAARVYREYAVLQNGSATGRGRQGFAVFADGLRVSSLSPLGAVVIGVKDRSYLEVAAQGAPAEVRNAAGVLVARLEAGKALGFTVQAAQASAGNQTQSMPQQENTTSPPAPPSPPPGQVATGKQLTVHGILRKDHAGRYGHFLLTDLTSNVTYELQGPGLDDLVGGSVEVTGSVFDTKPAETASSVLSVSDIHQMPLNEMTGKTTATAPATAPPTPAGDVPANETGTVGGATPEATPAPDVSAAPPPQIPAVVVHSDTAKILIIVGLAAGAGVGVALGLAGGKSSTVSPE